MSYTKGNFKDGHIGWKTLSRGKNPHYAHLGNLEVIWSEDQECVCDNVYQEDDAKLIAHAPTMLEGINGILAQFDGNGVADMEWVYNKLRELAKYK